MIDPEGILLFEDNHCRIPGLTFRFSLRREDGCDLFLAL